MEAKLINNAFNQIWNSILLWLQVASGRLARVNKLSQEDHFILQDLVHVIFLRP